MEDPPTTTGAEIISHGRVQHLSMFEVDGRKSKLYCQVFLLLDIKLEMLNVLFDKYHLRYACNFWWYKSVSTWTETYEYRKTSYCGSQMVKMYSFVFHQLDSTQYIALLFSFCWSSGLSLLLMCTRQLAACCKHVVSARQDVEWLIEICGCLIAESVSIGETFSGPQNTILRRGFVPFLYIDRKRYFWESSGWLFFQGMVNDFTTTLSS